MEMLVQKLVIFNIQSEKVLQLDSISHPFTPNRISHLSISPNQKCIAFVDEEFIKKRRTWLF